MHASPSAVSGPLAAVLCALLALVAWSGSVVRGGFAYDDAEVLSANPVVEGGASWTAAFERDYWDHLAPAGHYRPLATLSLRVDFALHGPTAPAGWHLTNVLLHAAVVLLLGLALLLVGPHGPRRVALPWVGLALFAVHPALADSVAWISGRSSMISAGAGLAGAVVLLALHVPRRDDRSGRLLLTALAAGLGLLGALLGKEDGVVFALLYAALAARCSRRALLAALAGVAAALAAYLSLRSHALGSPWPSSPHAPLAGEPLGARLLVAGRALLELTRLAALPVGYPPSYDRAALLRPPGGDVDASWLVLALLGWLPWLTLVLLGTRSLRERRSRPAGLSALLAAASLLPVLQLIPSGAVLAPRFLYLPLLFGAPCLHALWELVRPRVSPWILPTLLVACVLGAWNRAGVYADRASYHEQVLAHRPRDAPAWNELGLAREERGELAQARAAFERAARLDPTYSRPWSNLGRLALGHGDEIEAERCLRRAVELGPSNAVAHVNLGALLLRQQRAPEATGPYRRATELAPRLGAAWRGLGRALAESGAREQARSAIQRALEIDPADDRARQLLATLLAR